MGQPIWIADAQGKSICARCGGEGVIAFAVSEDADGNWDEEEVLCPDCGKA